MAFTVDDGTDRGKVRLLISDIDSATEIFDDDAIDAFISMALANHVKRAAATALIVMATNEVMVQKRIKILDISTDGPAEAAQLRLLAEGYQKEADDEEAADTDGAFDWAEIVVNPTTYRERVYKESLRGGTG